jgi:hypothetical protein
MAASLINGRAYSWADVHINILNTRVIGVKSISYDENEEMQDNFGAGNRPVNRSFGKIETEGSITLMMSEIEALQDASPTGRLQDIPEFDIIVSYLPNNGVIRNHTLKNCRFMANGRELGTDSLEITKEIPLKIAEIVWK